MDNSLNIVTVLILLVTFTLAFVTFKLFGFQNHKRYANGPWGVPILGHLPFFGQNPPQTFAKWRKIYGNVFRIRLGTWNTVILNGYEAIKEAADKPGDDFSSRPGFISSQIIKQLNNMDSFAFGPFNQTYLLERKLIVSALRQFINKLEKDTTDLIEDEAIELVDSLLAKDYSEPKNIKIDIQYAVGSVIHQFLYGRGKKDIVRKQLDAVIRILNKFVEFTGNSNPFDVMPWMRHIMPSKIEGLKRILVESNELRTEEIRAHIDTFSSGNIRDVADALLAADFNEQDEKKESLLFSQPWFSPALGDLHGAGFDTSNKSLQWLVVYMAAYPDVQQRVQKEIDDVIGSGRRVQLKDRPQLVYTDATIHEVMRIAVIAPFGIPRYTIKDTKIAGYDIDSETVVFFNLHSIMHDKEFWGDPENFRPSRLITENNELDTSKCCHILPFGLGRRRCVGEALAKMNLFILFTTLMQRCSVIKPDGVELDLEQVPGLVYSPKDNCLIVRER